MIGVYEIRNLVNNKRYIGSTKVSFESRWEKHLEGLKWTGHPNIHLQRAWDKYGKGNFVFNVVEVCNEKSVLECEQYWIDYYGMDKLYNKSPYANGGNPGKPYPAFYNTITREIIPEGVNLSILAKQLNINRCSLSELVRETAFCRKGYILLSNKDEWTYKLSIRTLKKLIKQLTNNLEKEGNQLIRTRKIEIKRLSKYLTQLYIKSKNSIFDKDGSRILTKDQVRSIRQKYTGKHGQQAQLAEEYEVSPNTIHSIVTGKTWVWLK